MASAETLAPNTNSENPDQMSLLWHPAEMVPDASKIQDYLLLTRRARYTFHTSQIHNSILIKIVYAETYILIKILQKHDIFSNVVRNAMEELLPS